MAVVSSIDSNVTGLRYALEDSLGVVSGDEIWIPLEPNSYNDFGGNFVKVARNPINDSRQRKKGVVVGLDAVGGFVTDLTQVNMQDILQGFMFADFRNKVEFGGAGEITNVDGVTEDYDAASGLDAFQAGDLVFAAGFTNTENNGLKTVTAAAATALTVGEDLVAEAAPPATATLVTVGFEMGSAELDMVVTAGLAVLTRASGVADFTTMGLIPGEWIFVGGDGASTDFVGSNNNGRGRVKVVTATTITLDKTEFTPTNETGTGLTIQLFFGRVLKNETGVLIVRKSYQLERTLGAPDDSLPAEIQAEYVVGAMANQLTLGMAVESIITADLAFIGTDHETITGPVALKAGTRPALVELDAYNAADQVMRSRLTVVDPADSNPTALFAEITDIDIQINNNLSPNKSIGRLGAFGITAGTFEISGNVTAYFSDVAAIAAIRGNSDVTMDFHMAESNVGMAIDIPLTALGEGKLDIQQDQSIKIPVAYDAATGAKVDPNLNHTLMFTFFDYLPTAAEA